MDKRKVIDAYRQGLFSVQECAQLLGLDKLQLSAVLSSAEDDTAAIHREPSRLYSKVK